MTTADQAAMDRFKTCEHCQFWLTMQPGGLDSRVGECRRFPPQITTRVYTLSANENAGRDESQVESNISAEWPEVKSTDWCGEWLRSTVN